MLFCCLSYTLTNLKCYHWQESTYHHYWQISASPSNKQTQCSEFHDGLAVQWRKKITTIMLPSRKTFLYTQIYKRLHVVRLLAMLLPVTHRLLDLSEWLDHYVKNIIDSHPRTRRPGPDIVVPFLWPIISLHACITWLSWSFFLLWWLQGVRLQGMSLCYEMWRLASVCICHILLLPIGGIPRQSFCSFSTIIFLASADEVLSMMKQEGWWATEKYPFQDLNEAIKEAMQWSCMTETLSDCTLLLPITQATTMC